MEYVVHSEVVKRCGNRCTFRIGYYSNENREFKNYDFECVQSTASMIIYLQYLNLSKFGDMVVHFRDVDPSKAIRNFTYL